MKLTLPSERHSIDTRAKLDAALAALGYRISGTERYDNRANAIHYPAMMVDLSDIETGRSAFHHEGRRDSRFRRLQEMRTREPEIVIAGRVWEL